MKNRQVAVGLMNKQAALGLKENEQAAIGLSTG
jgi:hypothetical protein